jgi:chromate transporter
VRELAALFLRLGATAFGGPAAHVALMRDEVKRRGWMSDAEFLDFLGVANLIPGPTSTEMAMHIGYHRRGLAGLVVAGVCFILPAALITFAFAVAYARWGTTPAAGWLLYGVKPVVLAVVAQAIVKLAPAAVRDVPLGVLGAIAVAAVVLGAPEIATLLAAGLAGIALRRLRDRRPPAHVFFLPLAALGAAGAAAVTLPGIFVAFLKIGGLLFGSGYVLLALLQADLVERLGWLTQAQLLDAVAVGQVSPGPLFSTATFIGYLLAGGPGALVATVGIFLPAFVLVAVSGPLVPRLRASPTASGFLDGVNVAALGLMGVVAVELGRAAFVDVWTVLLGVAAAALLVFASVNATWLILGGAAAGALVHALS